MRLSSEYGTRHMLSNSMMKENDVKIGNMDKVFKRNLKWLVRKNLILYCYVG
jgi:hypothetical protein